eukprot:c18775_g1_i1 orf=569-2947(+)
MKLGGFSITAAANVFGGKNYSNSTDMPSGIMAAGMPSPGVPPRTSRTINSSAGFSLTLTSRLEGQRDMITTEENNSTKPKDDEYESRSGSDNLDGGSGDEHDPDQPPPGKKRYHRHSAFQIQEMEAFFKEFPHPDENQRQLLSKHLNLATRQVKFWFQNRRTQMKAQQERQENAFLRQENESLRAENVTMREAIKNASCPTCGGPTAIEMSMEEQQMRIENTRMRGELERLYAMSGRIYSSGPISPTVPSPHGSIVCSDIPGVINLGAYRGGPVPDIAPATSIPCVVPTKLSLLSDYEKSLVADLAVLAMDEFLEMVSVGEPLWLLPAESGKEVLDLGEYFHKFSRPVGPRPIGFTSEATRASGVVIMNGASIVESFLDVNRWMEMFSCIIARAEMGTVISTGAPVTRHGALQLMNAELQILSPLVPIREINFLRFCQLVQENVWAIVDVSVDALRGDFPPPANRVRRRPSGCLIHEMVNGYSKVTWVEHIESENRAMHGLFRMLVQSGMAFGAQRWLATLQRQCECFANLMASTITSTKLGGLPTPEGRRSMLKLAQRMTTGFCNSVSASSVHNWMTLSGNNDENEVRIMAWRDKPGDPSGMVLSAATSIWLPVYPQHLFEFLRNESRRKEWDVLAGGGPMQEMIHVAKGQDPGNSVSLLRTFQGGANNMLILQECCTDLCGSLVVYAPIDIQSMNAVMTGGDHNLVSILPSGFAILPDGSESKLFGLLDESGGSLENPGSGGSLLTVAFQILVNSIPGVRLTLESINTVNSLISNTVKHIKLALQCEKSG